jgi:hypothetical protein
MYGYSLGRFTSPDPLMSSAEVGDAQSWNRYAYTGNNPLRYTDPTGMFIWVKRLGGALDDKQLRESLINEANEKTDPKKREKAIKRQIKRQME